MIDMLDAQRVEILMDSRPLLNPLVSRILPLVLFANVVRIHRGKIKSETAIGCGDTKVRDRVMGIGRGLNQLDFVTTPDVGKILNPMIWRLSPFLIVEQPEFAAVRR